MWNHKNNSSLSFLPSQRWRSTAEKDTLPYCKLQRAQINSILDQWQNIGSPEDIMAKFLNLHCLETNVIEGTMEFDLSVSFSVIVHLVLDSLTSFAGYNQTGRSRLLQSSRARRPKQPHRRCRAKPCRCSIYPSRYI